MMNFADSFGSGGCLLQRQVVRRYGAVLDAGVTVDEFKVSVSIAVFEATMSHKLACSYI